MILISGSPLPRQRSAHVSVMSSGNVSFNVYVNGYIVRLARTLDRPVLGQRQWNTDERDAIPDLSPRRFDIKPFLVYGKNAIGIVATTHVEDVGGVGNAVQNYVRSGIMATAVIR